MPSNTDHVLTDLIAEVAALDAHLSAMSESDWSVSTPAPGWDVADQVIHLGLIDRRAMWSMVDPDRFVNDMADMMASGGLDAIQKAEREKSPQELIEWWREGAADLARAAESIDLSARCKWYGPSMSGTSMLTARLMETWAHGQDIADALRGVKVPVLIKNPLNPDLELWVGGMERIAKAGIEELGLIHRGFSSYGNTEFRNAPMWHLAIEMKRRFPGIPMINDPSHICGRRDILQEVAQQAIDLDFDGLIIESHIDPDNAWSDAKQQITPEVLKELLEAIRWRKENIASEEFHTALEKLRQQINQLDDELLTVLSTRMKVAQKIGEYKKNNDITILQTNRWNEILERAVAKGNKMGLSDDFITKYMDAVHMESIQQQNKIMNS